MAYEVGTRPSFNYWRSNLSTSNQILATVVVSERVRVLSIGAYFAGSSGQSATSELLVFSGAGVLLGRSGQFASAPGSGTSGGQRWEVRAPSAELILAAGTYIVGWWRSSAQWGEFSYQSGVGQFYDQTSTGGVVTPGGALQAGQIGRILSVEAAPITPPVPEPPADYWSGSAWVRSDVDVWNGSQWVRTKLG